MSPNASNAVARQTNTRRSDNITGNTIIIINQKNTLHINVAKLNFYAKSVYRIIAQNDEYIFRNEYLILLSMSFKIKDIVSIL